MSTSRDMLFDTAPEFYTTDAAELARIDRFLARAAAQLSPTTWCTLYQEGVVNLTAHLLTLAARSAGGGSSGVGSVSSERVGDLSRSYQYQGATKRDSDRSLGSTVYGSEYLRLRAMVCVRTPLVVTGDDQC